MNPITIGEHCTIEYLSEVPCAMIRWNGLPPSDEFRKGCMAVLDLMKIHGLTKIITDNRQAKVFKIEDQRWLNDEWLPQAQQLGYRYSAVLVKEHDPFITFAVKNIMAKRETSKFEAQFFSQPENAIQWLKTLN
ncbi:MAG: hypothetical protein AB7E36_04820 [Salinivirgaceae bacterium]